MPFNLTKTEFQAIQDAFLDLWPREKLDTLTLEEYSNRDMNSLTYWLEFKTQSLGSIKGGSSLKFLVYNRKERSSQPPKKNWETDGVHAWQASLGASANEAFEVVKVEIIQIVEAAKRMDFATIEKSKLFGPALKWKLAAMYNSERIFQVFNLSVANEMLRMLGGYSDAFEPASSLPEAQQKLTELKPPKESALSFLHEVYAQIDATSNAKFEGAHLSLIDAHPELDLLDPRLGSPWLSALTVDQWEATLSGMASLLAALDLKQDDPRLSISLRNDTSRQRLAIMLGGQLICSVGLVKGVPTMRYQMPKESELPDGGSFDSFQPSIGVGSMIQMPIDGWRSDRAWLDAVVEVARAELKRTKSSPYQSSHRPYLLDVLQDTKARSSFVAFAGAPLQRKLVEVYKRILVVRGIPNERYKWQWFGEFSENWNLEATDFGEMKRWMRFDNLMDSRAHSFWRVLWEDPEEARSYFRGLFNADQSIEQRIEFAKIRSKEILQARKPNWNTSGQDERTLSMLWAAMDIEHHAPYKYSFYTRFCQQSGLKSAGNAKRYQHYLELIQAFASDWIEGDNELLQAHQEALGEEIQLKDPNHHLLSQNIWYMVLDQLWTEQAQTDDDQAPSGVDEPSGNYRQPLQFFDDSFLSAATIHSMLDGLQRKKNIILQGPPGTGKTFIAKRLAYELLNEKDDSRVEVVQFHQSYSYEDFIQGFRPRKEGGFERRNGVFYRFCERARDDADSPYFFVIDEINRGNLSKIFGELMMLIEADKRGEQHEVQLTYSEEDEHFSIPENVHVIGTMNTADRSLAMVDYALRRRFLFFNLPPQFNDAFKAHLLHRAVSEVMVAQIESALILLNARIASDPNLGAGFEIGHSYFCSGCEDGQEEAVWYRQIIEQEVGPQLREFWFDDTDEADHQIDLLLKCLEV